MRLVQVSQYNTVQWAWCRLVSTEQYIVLGAGYSVHKLPTVRLRNIVFSQSTATHLPLSGLHLNKISSVQSTLTGCSVSNGQNTEILGGKNFLVAHYSI